MLSLTASWLWAWTSVGHMSCLTSAVSCHLCSLSLALISPSTFQSWGSPPLCVLLELYSWSSSQKPALSLPSWTSAPLQAEVRPSLPVLPTSPQWASSMDLLFFAISCQPYFPAGVDFFPAVQCGHSPSESPGLQPEEQGSKRSSEKNVAKRFTAFQRAENR